MKQTFLVLLAVSLSMVACGKKTVAGVADEASNDQRYASFTLDSLRFDERIRAASDTMSEGMEISHYFEFPVKAKEGVALESLQKTFSRIYLNDSTFEGTPTEAFAKEKERMTKEALREGELWLEMVKEMGEVSVSFSYYEERRRLEVEAEYENLISLSLDSYGYQGGAHGYGASAYYTVDLRDGKILNDTILFGKDNLKEVEKLLREDIKSRVASDEDSEGYLTLLVGVDAIVPNNNLFFTSEGISYLYNQYEIAPYAAGQIEISLPYEQVLPLVSDAYRKEIEAIQKSFL